jgi:hypothetical protein
MFSLFRRKSKTLTEVDLSDTVPTEQPIVPIIPIPEFEVGANALAAAISLRKQDGEYLMDLLNRQGFKLIPLETPTIEATPQDVETSAPAPYQPAIEKAIRISDGQEVRIIDLLTMIIDGRGRCGFCKLDCEGPGGGTTPSFCPNVNEESSHRPCFWEDGDNAARAQMIKNIF